MALPSDYYDYNYDVGTLAETPPGYNHNSMMYKKQNKLFTRLSAASRDDDIDRDHYGTSGYGGGGCYEEGVSIGLLLTTAFGIAIMGYTLYTKIKANGGKRKRRGVLDILDVRWFSLYPEIILMGRSFVFDNFFIFFTCFSHLKYQISISVKAGCTEMSNILY